MTSKNDQYLSFGGNRCPGCGSGDLDAKSVEVHGGNCSQPIKCLACGIEWRDLYTLTGFESEDIDADSSAIDCEEPATSTSTEAVAEAAWYPHQIYFTRQEGLIGTTIAVLDLLTRLPMDDDEVMGCLRLAVSEWVKETKTGREAWLASSEDMNIGDLLSGSGFTDPDLVTRMQTEGIRFVGGSITGGPDSYAFDTVLADHPGDDDDLGEMEPDETHEASEV